jgi:hypothetical protein
MTGVSWIEESGTMAGPIAITNTHAVGIAHASIIRWTVKHHPDLAEAWLLPVAAETWDGYLNDINGGHVTVDIGLAALESASSGPIDEGSVGGGSGMNCYEFKGGSGTSSRLVEHDGTTYTVGVFLQTNFGARHELVIAGVPLGAELADDNPLEEYFSPPAPARVSRSWRPTHRCSRANARRSPAGSPSDSLAPAPPVRISPATSSSLSRPETPARSRRDPRPVRTRSSYDELRFVPWDTSTRSMKRRASTEEAVVDSLVANSEMIGFRGHRTPALPRDRLVKILKARGRDRLST